MKSKKMDGGKRLAGMKDDFRRRKPLRKKNRAGPGTLQWRRGYIKRKKRLLSWKRGKEENLSSGISVRRGDNCPN